MHVLYICHEYPPTVAGGIGTAVATLARGMARAGHEVTVLGMYDRPPSIDHDQGVTVNRLRGFRRGRLTTWLLLRIKLRAEIVKIHRRQPIDVIEWPDWDGWWMTGIRGITDVLKVHGGRVSHRVHGYGYRSRLYEYLELRMMRRFQNWIGVSKWFNDEWREYSRAKPRREEIVYNPVDTDVFHPEVERDPKTVFYAGGLRTRKGVISLARAAKHFLAENAGAQLVMATFKDDVTHEQFLCETGPVANRVRFLPFMDQTKLAGQLARSTVFAMPSFYESCGNGWLEAAACGIPVVGSTLSCGPEVISDGETGFLPNPHEPREVADKVSLLLNNPCLAHEMGRAGRARALRLFSLAVAVKKSERFYEECRGIH